RLAAALPARPPARTRAAAHPGHVLAVGVTSSGRHPGARPLTGARAPLGLRVRAGARALPPDPRRPLARVLGRGRSAAPGLAPRARLVPPPRPPAQGDAAGVGRSRRLRALPGAGTEPPDPEIHPCATPCRCCWPPPPPCWPAAAGTPPTPRPRPPSSAPAAARS